MARPGEIARYEDGAYRAVVADVAGYLVLTEGDPAAGNATRHLLGTVEDILAVDWLTEVELAICLDVHRRGQLR